MSSQLPDNLEVMITVHWIAFMKKPAVALFVVILVYWAAWTQSVLGSSRNDRVWPLSSSSSVDFGKSSAFGPRLMASSKYR